MSDKNWYLKINYSGIKFLWITLSIIYMVFYGITAYKSVYNAMDNKSAYLINIFKTIYSQNAIQLVSNPDNFERVIVSDIEGEVLLQYGDLIPALTNLNYTEIFKRVQTDKIVLSDFYQDLLSEKTCFDMAMIEKNRVYLGTLSAEGFLEQNLENLDLDGFMILDSTSNGYIYKNSEILPINTYNRDSIVWHNNALFSTDKKMYFYHSKNLNNFRIIAYHPFIKEIFPYFLYSIIPFLFGLFIIFLAEKLSAAQRDKRVTEIENCKKYILQEKEIPEKYLKNDDFIELQLFKEINNSLNKHKNDRAQMKRYVDRLSSLTESIMDMKTDMEYMEKYLFNIMNKEEIDYNEATITLFKLLFQKNHKLITAHLKIDGTSLFSIVPDDKDESVIRFNANDYHLLELGEKKVEFAIFSEYDYMNELISIRKTVFELFARYLSFIIAIKNGQSTENLSLTKNFSTFSEMVQREIDKAKRYQNKGILFFLNVSNYHSIKDKYGISVSKTILNRISEIIISDIRKSDIFGIYKEGIFLIYFCNLDEENTKDKINSINQEILEDKKIKQIGIDIGLRTSVSVVDKQTKDFNSLLLDCLGKAQE